jgi:hypothetical protein
MNDADEISFMSLGAESSLDEEMAAYNGIRV